MRRILRSVDPDERAMRRLVVAGVLSAMLLLPTASDAAVATTWTHDYSLHCSASSPGSDTASTCYDAMDGVYWTNAQILTDLQIGQQLVDDAASCCPTQLKLTLTSGPRCATGWMALQGTYLAPRIQVSPVQQTIKFDLRKGNTTVLADPNWFTGPWRLKITAHVNGLNSQDCPGLPAQTDFPLSAKLESTPNSGSVGGLYQFQTRSRKLQLWFNTTGAGKLDVQVRVRPVHRTGLRFIRGKWIKFGHTRRTASKPEAFKLTLSPKGAAKRLVHSGRNFEVYTAVTMKNSYGKSSTAEAGPQTFNTIPLPPRG